MAEPRHRLTLAASGIFAMAFAVRLLHVWQMRATPYFSVLMGDSRGYDEWARRIASGEWLGRDVFYQAPLYPYMLGVIYATAGRHLLVVRLIQASIGSASCVLLTLAAARLISTRTGIAAGVMLALYAPAVFFDGLIQKSVLDVFFICLVLWIVAAIVDGGAKLPTAADARSARTRPSAPWFGLGLTMGALALTRENALVLTVVILAWALWPNQNQNQNPEPRTPNPEPRVLHAALFAAGLALVLVPVAARNAYVGGGFYITTSQAGPNFYIGNNPRADGTYQSLRFGRGAPEYERQDATELAEAALGRTLSPAEVSSYWRDKGLDFITSQPGAWLKLMARKVALLFNATETLDTESQEAHAEYSLTLRVLGVVGHFGLVVPLAVVGAIATWPMRRRLRVLYALTGTYALSVIVFYVFARYRYPLVPMLMMFAAPGAIEIAGLFSARSTNDPLATDRAHQKPINKTKPVRSAGASASSAFRANQLRVAAAAAAATAIFCNWPLLSTRLMRAVTHTNLAVALQADGRVDEATAEYERAIALEPGYAPAYNNLGTALRAKGRLDAAAAAYQRALALRADYPEAHYNLANVLTDEGKAAEAADHFRVALQTLSGSADVHNNLGIALMADGKRDEAAAEFRAAVAADPASAKAHRNLADALASIGRPADAVEEFRRAATLAPDDAAIRYDLGSFLLELNRPDDAIHEFRASLALNAKSPQTHNNLGIALASAGRVDEALGEFRAALALDPQFADAKRNLAMALRQQQKR